MPEQAKNDCEATSRVRALRLAAEDNVAVVLADVVNGPVAVLGYYEDETIAATVAISRGHKIALRRIAVGGAVIKYGVPIGFATSAIDAGAWVHTHNCRSGLDERSHTLDPHTGAATDTQYV